MNEEVRVLRTLCDNPSGRHNDPNPQGYCTWCGRKIASRSIRFAKPVGYVSDMDEYYDMFYDPNYNA